MTEFLTSYAGLIAVVSLIIGAVACLFAADANGRADGWQAWAEQLEAENAHLRGRHPGVVALPPRKDGDRRG